MIAKTRNKRSSLFENSDIFPILSFNKLCDLIQIPPNDLRDLANSAGKFYNPFDIKEYKDDGNIKWRHIDNPDRKLKLVQTRINKRLLRPLMLNLPENMVGGVPNKSITDNAKNHVRKEMVVRLDLRNCFPNTTHEKTYDVWSNYLACGNEVSHALTKITTFQTRLPQGAPTSLALCNLVLLPMFETIESIISEKGCDVSLYVDDITISGDHDVTLDLIEKTIKAIQTHGYAVGSTKKEIMPASTQQGTTGIVTNDKLSKGWRKLNELRGEIISISRNSDNLTQSDINSLKGKIVQTKSISKSQAQSLQKLMNSLLDNFEASDKPALKSRKETRKCNSTRKHRHNCYVGNY